MHILFTFEINIRGIVGTEWINCTSVTSTCYIDWHSLFIAYFRLVLTLVKFILTSLLTHASE